MIIVNVSNALEKTWSQENILTVKNELCHEKTGFLSMPKQ